MPGGAIDGDWIRSWGWIYFCIEIGDGFGKNIANAFAIGIPAVGWIVGVG